MEIKFTKPQIKLLKQRATVVKTKTGIYYYLPYWYKETNKENVLDKISFEHLPVDLQSAIRTQRNPIRKR
jgi:hypothetical protein